MPPFRYTILRLLPTGNTWLSTRQRIRTSCGLMPLNIDKLVLSMHLTERAAINLTYAHIEKRTRVRLLYIMCTHPYIRADTNGPSDAQKQCYKNCASFEDIVVPLSVGGPGGLWGPIDGPTVSKVFHARFFPSFVCPMKIETEREAGGFVWGWREMPVDESAGIKKKKKKKKTSWQSLHLHQFIAPCYCLLLLEHIAY